MARFTKKQREYIRKATHRWNVKIGAVRSGKTYPDVRHIIIERVLAGRGKDGLNVIMGVSQSTITRNIIEPMQQIFGTKIVTDINSKNYCYIAGERVYCLGAEKISQVAKIQGTSIKYCYGDEITKWNVEVFQMLKSRLDKIYSIFDGTLNPESPTHWILSFLNNKDLDIYAQHYTIDDNTFLSKDFIRNLKAEYLGTIYYARYILGKWARAEGSVFPPFANNKDEFICDDSILDDVAFYAIGVDFGGNKSATTFTLSGILKDGKGVVIVDERYYLGTISPQFLESKLIEFITVHRNKNIVGLWCDSAEQILIKGIKLAMIDAKIGVRIYNSLKLRIKDRIMFSNRMMNLGRFFILPNCKKTIEALQDSVYSKDETRLDDGTTNIDSLDSMEYSLEKFMSKITLAGGLK